MVIKIKIKIKRKIARKTKKAIKIEINEKLKLNTDEFTIQFLP